MNGRKWKFVRGYRGLYSVSDRGVVRSDRNRTRSKRGAELQPATSTNGYQIVGLSRNGIRKTQLVHRIVAAAFLGPARWRQVNHLNGDKRDNRVENLQWCRSAENERHKHEVLGHARPFRGSRNPHAVLTEQNARAILAAWAKRTEGRYAAGHPLSLDGLAKRFGVRIAAISRLVRRETWKHLTPEG